LEATSGLGIGTAILQARDVSPARLASAFWFTMGVATLMVLLVSVSSPWLAAWFNAEGLAPLIAVSSLKLWFVSAALLPLTLLNRRTRFREIAAIQTGATLCSALITCTLVVLGYGAWGLVLGQTSHGLITALLSFVISPYRPRGGFTLRESRSDITFGLQVTASSLLYHFYRNVDYYLIGRLLGVGAVGVYRVAFDLAMTPTMAVLGVISRSAVPVFARLNDRVTAVRDAFLWTLGSLGQLLAPVTVALLFLADELLLSIDDGKWIDAAPMVRWLAIAALLRSHAQVFPQIFHALRRPALAMLDSAVTAVIVSSLIGCLLVVYGSEHGAVVAAWGWALAYPLELAMLFVLVRALLEMTPGALAHATRHTLGSIGVMVAAQLGVQASVPALPVWGIVTIKLGVLVVTYACYLYFIMGVSIARDIIGRPTAIEPPPSQ
jgi:O-antigen/teichoic acid export membrane protein